MLAKLRYTYVAVVSVEYRGKSVLYHLVIASRSKGAGKWLGNYEK